MNNPYPAPAGPYRVEMDDSGCLHCQHDQTFHVIGPDEVASSTSYGDREEAEDLARALDAAYELGRQSVKVVDTDPWTSFAKGKPSESVRILVWDREFNDTTAIYYMSEVYTDEHLAAMRYTHWMLATFLPGPRGAPETEQPAPTAEPPTIQPPPVLETPSRAPDFDDDIPFGFAGLIPLAGLLAYAAKALFQV